MSSVAFLRGLRTSGVVAVWEYPAVSQDPPPSIKFPGVSLKCEVERLVYSELA